MMENLVALIYVEERRDGINERRVAINKVDKYGKLIPRSKEDDFVEAASMLTIDPSKGIWKHRGKLPTPIGKGCIPQSGESCILEHGDVIGVYDPNKLNHLDSMSYIATIAAR